ncbi:MAG TPA: hypothetical protein VGB63_02955 [Pedobacter sp.]|jgi:xanthine/uracil permease
MKISKRLAQLITFQKFIGIFLITIGIPMLLVDGSKGSEMPLLVGLFTLFTSPGAIEDERSLSLKTWAVYTAFIIGYAFKLLSSNLHSHNLFPTELTEINHFIILVFSLSLIIYYIRFYSSNSNTDD